MNTRASVLDMMKSDHKRITELFNQVMAAPRGEKKRKALYAELRREISRHSLVEDEMLYVLLKNNPATQAFLKIAGVQHGIIDKLVSRLDSTPMAHEHWDRVFRDLRETFITHMKHEEAEVVQYIPRRTMRDIPAYLRIA